MKDRRKRDLLSWSRFFWCTVFIVCSCVLFNGISFPAFRFLFQETAHPVVIPTWPNPAMEAVSSGNVSPAVSILATVVFPDQSVIFLKYPHSAPLFTKEDIQCVYLFPNASNHHPKLPPSTIDSHDRDTQIVRCPLALSGPTVSLSLQSNGHLNPGPTHHWNSLAYEAVIDYDNSTVVFVKGLSRRPGRASDPTKFECVYGLDFTRPNLVLRSEVLSLAQEIVRCKTPLSVLSGLKTRFHNESILVTVRVKGQRTLLPSVARPKPLPETESAPTKEKPHEMCVCTMLRNQARFLREWIMYHTRIGVQRWFIYDNNSDDDIGQLIESLEDSGFNITRHMWPWIKTQEAGFSHCALRARPVCKWVGFIDVDEFFHLPSGIFLHDVLKNDTKLKRVGEIRTWCYSFGPSGLTRRPPQGVMIGYTCRLMSAERHKSIVRPEALDATLINVVHHFQLREGFKYLKLDKYVMVINHYKYQVWEVFKDKFYRRVATYVADWQNKENAGSKDRAPGLGTDPVEPTDWSTRFCEFKDTSLRDRVNQTFTDPITGLLPWQEEGDEEDTEALIEKIKSRRRKRHLGLGASS